MRDNRGTRWAGLAMAGLGVTAALGATMCVIKAGDTATVSHTGTAPRTVVATVGPASPRVTPQAVTISAQAAEVPVRVGSGAATAAQPRLDLRQIVYTVAGNQRPDDPVTVVYADETGALRVLHNVTLPWTMTIVPNLPVNYVTANSHGSQLNCWITDAAGATVVSQTDYGIATTCNR